MGLWVEALTAGLSGHGRADPKEGWGSTTFVQVLDPALAQCAQSLGLSLPAALPIS